MYTQGTLFSSYLKSDLSSRNSTLVQSNSSKSLFDGMKQKLRGRAFNQENVQRSNQSSVEVLEHQKKVKQSLQKKTQQSPSPAKQQSFLTAEIFSQRKRKFFKNRQITDYSTTECSQEKIVFDKQCNTDQIYFAQAECQTEPKQRVLKQNTNQETQTELYFQESRVNSNSYISEPTQRFEEIIKENKFKIERQIQINELNQKTKSQVHTPDSESQFNLFNHKKEQSVIMVEKPQVEIEINPYFQDIKSQKISKNKNQLKVARELTLSVFQNLDEIDNLEIYQNKPMNNQNVNIVQSEEIIEQNLEKCMENYKNGMKCLNSVGNSVVLVLEYLNGLQNFWVIPLFLVFKRMFQLRKQAYEQVKQRNNLFNFNQWDQITDSQQYLDFMQLLQNENNLVEQELYSFLNAAKNKLQKLEETRKSKVEWFVNDDLQRDIKQTSYVYFYTQIYEYIKNQIKNENFKRYTKQQWYKLAVYVQNSIIILEQPVYQYSENIINICKILEQQELNEQQIINLWEELEKDLILIKKLKISKD